MPAGEIVDPTKNPVNRLWRFFLRIGIPVLGVILVSFVVVGVTLHSYHTTKAGISKLSHVILRTEQSRISEEILSYLNPATKGGGLAVDMLSHIPSEYKWGMFYSYAMSSLHRTKQAESFYLADSDGRFNMVERVPDHPDQVRVITLEPDQKGGRFLEEYHIFDSKKVIKTRYMPANAYDPRLRAWYHTAVENNKLTWSSPVLMPTKKGLAVTASIPFVDKDGKKNVFAMNISLQELTKFLASIKLSNNARIIIIDNTGHIIASPNLLTYFVGNEWNPQDSKINPAVNPVIARAYDQFQIQGSGIHSFKMEKKPDLGQGQDQKKNSKNIIDKQKQVAGNYICVTSRLPDSIQKWVIMIVIPEKDFSGFVASGAKQNLLFSLLVVALAASMAGLLIYQGHRMDKLGLRFQHIQNVVEQESDAIEMVASTPEVFDPRNEALILTEKLCKLVSAHRVSIWHFSTDHKSLICNDIYDRTEDNHAGGYEYSISELPNFFELLDAGETVVVDNAEHDQRTAALYRLFMSSVSTRSLMITPVLGKNGTIGAILVEDTPYLYNINHITKIFAGLVTMRFVAAQVEFDQIGKHQRLHYENGKVSSQKEFLKKTVKDDLENTEKDINHDYLIDPGQFLKNKIDFGQFDKQGEQTIYPAVAMMDISFSGFLSSDIQHTVELIKPVKNLVIVLEQIAQKYGIFYVRIMGGHLIAVTGCSKEPDITAPIRLAQAAIDMREACLEIIPHKYTSSTFGIGIDVGPAIGSWFGKDAKTFALWGPVVGMSSLMAQMAKDDATIQVTQEAYAALRNDFLFRSRGNFFIPDMGVADIFILAGRR